MAKWAKLNELDRRTAVGSKAWTQKHQGDAARLSAWRALHGSMSHEAVKKAGGKKLSTDQMVQLINRKKKR